MPRHVEEHTEIIVKFKPLLKNIPSYMRFFNELSSKYSFIMGDCATTVSKHFTTLTSVINEGNSYEFPSKELHKSIINKIIMHDKKHFMHFFIHIK